MFSETFALGFQWPAADPFLFIAHHHDAFPSGDDRMSPATGIAGRDIGNDFSGLDGWNMYHGSVVPGFPRHPHRGFETITFVRSGLVDHSDSLGATARFGHGDTQWLTAGGGIEHCEMMPLTRSDADNPLELFQIWLNLPRANKMVTPHFTMLWSEGLEIIDNGSGARVTVIVGAWPGAEVREVPPDSWAAAEGAEVGIFEAAIEPNGTLELPATGPDTRRSVYNFGEHAVAVGGVELPAQTGGRLTSTEPAEVVAPEGSSLLIMQGKPIGEPVAQYGPFVMNDRAGIVRAFEDYEAGRFGTWPWPSPDPVHPRERQRFALHPDGRLDEPPSR
jgi:redox-sensitive bicupin YhaK (pirin superfamily)